MDTESEVAQEETVVDSGFGADTSSGTEEEVAAADAKAAESEELESEDESPPSVEDNDEEKTDPVQERIDTLTKKFRDSERREAQILADNEALRKQIADTPKPAEPMKTLEDFEFDENKYREYFLNETTSRAEAAAERVVRGFQDKQHTETVADRFAVQEKAFEDTVSDYKEVAYSRDLSVTEGMASEIKNSDIGAEMLYYLGKNPEVASELSKSSPRSVIREMALLESRLISEKSKAKAKTVSAAPAPAAKIAAGNASLKVATNDPRSDKMSDEDWFKQEAKRTAKMR